MDHWGSSHPPVWCSWSPDGGCANVTSIVFSFLATLTNVSLLLFISVICVEGESGGACGQTISVLPHCGLTSSGGEIVVTLASQDMEMHHRETTLFFLHSSVSLFFGLFSFWNSPTGVPQSYSPVWGAVRLDEGTSFGLTVLLLVLPRYLSPTANILLSTNPICF